ncbi:hypothetical protein GB864_17060 [Agromyces sp. MMS17-SY077]|uniref:Serine/arginine repetitive matrix protein 2 n=2 Tax=Agromyces seonyuensis TaxID=2662446 RepID=A0A6I4P1J3_9MICO|nr:hypothetical protein [Agromyces seonyuensis]
MNQNPGAKDARPLTFRDSEGLRRLLTRLGSAGQDAWRRDPEASELMAFTAQRYAALARKHGLDPWEAATAAFVVMRAAATVRADDPWAVVTQAVKITCIAEERSQGLLCSVDKARRAEVSVHHDAERFSDREHELPEYHPAFRSAPADEVLEVAGQHRVVASAVHDAVTFFVLLGWPESRSHEGVELVCGRLADAPSRISAFDTLRRDVTTRVLLDLPQRAWTTMLRALLGSCDDVREQTMRGRGILYRLISGESVRDLLGDEDLVEPVVVNAPRMLS